MLYSGQHCPRDLLKPTNGCLGITQSEILQNIIFMSKLTAYFKIKNFFLILCISSLTHHSLFPDFIISLMLAFERSLLISIHQINWPLLKIWPLGIAEIFGNFEIHCIELCPCVA